MIGEGVAIVLWILLAFAIAYAGYHQGDGSDEMDTQKTLMNTLNALIIIDQDANLVTDAQVARQNSKLDPPKPGEKVLGTVIDPLTLKLFTLMHQLQLKTAKLLTEARGAEDDDTQHRLEEETNRINSLAKVAGVLFWDQVNSDVSSWQVSNVGIRRDWVVVAIEETSDPLTMLRSLFNVKPPED